MPGNDSDSRAGAPPRRRTDGMLVVGRPGDYSVYRDRNLDGSRGAGWHFDVMLRRSFVRGWRFTKAGAIVAGRRRARAARRAGAHDG